MRYGAQGETFYFRNRVWIVCGTMLVLVHVGWRWVQDQKNIVDKGREYPWWEVSCPPQRIRLTFSCFVLCLSPICTRRHATHKQRLCINCSSSEFSGTSGTRSQETSEKTEHSFQKFTVIPMPKVRFLQCKQKQRMFLACCQ